MVKSVKRPVNGKTREVHSVPLYSRSIIEASLAPGVIIRAEQEIVPFYKAPNDSTDYTALQMIGCNFSGYFDDPKLLNLIR